jgi:hypothetical protein
MSQALFIMLHLPVIILITIMCVIPFSVIDLKRSNKAYKKLAIQTKSDTVVHMNYRVFHIVFKPSWEVVAGALYILYFIMFVRENLLRPVHVAIIWLLYFAVRSWKNMTHQSIRDGYILNFVFISINQLLIIFHLLCDGYCRDTECGWPRLMFVNVLLALLIVKLSYYFFKFLELERALAA